MIGSVKYKKEYIEKVKEESKANYKSEIISESNPYISDFVSTPTLDLYGSDQSCTHLRSNTKKEFNSVSIQCETTVLDKYANMFKDKLKSLIESGRINLLNIETLSQHAHEDHGEQTSPSDQTLLRLTKNVISQLSKSNNPQSTSSPSSLPSTSARHQSSMDSTSSQFQPPLYTLPSTRGPTYRSSVRSEYFSTLPAQSTERRRPIRERQRSQNATTPLRKKSQERAANKYLRDVQHGYSTVKLKNPRVKLKKFNGRYSIILNRTLQ